MTSPVDFNNKKILIIGASSDLAAPLIKTLKDSNARLGLHYNSTRSALDKYNCDSTRLLQMNLNTSENCFALVDRFHEWAGGLDILIQLSGNVSNPVHWEKLSSSDIESDIMNNLLAPLYICQRSVKYMKKNGGRIVLMSNAGASHGGGINSLVYGIAKAGIERLTRGLAKEYASANILVNSVAPGFIDTRFHKEKMKRTLADVEKRVSLIPMKRAGTADEVAAVILFLISDESSFVTGETIAITGGDWL